MDSQLTVEVDSGLDILKDFYRSHLVKFLKLLNLQKHLIVDPSLVHMITDLIGQTNCKVIQISTLSTTDCDVNHNEAPQAVVYIIRPEQSKVL